MTDQPITPPQFVDDDAAYAPTVTLPRRKSSAAPRSEEARPSGRVRRLLATVDVYMSIIIGALLAFGLIMVFSTTFDLSRELEGSETAFFLRHVRNATIGLTALTILMIIDYRLLRRFAVWVLLFAIGSLIGVLFFGDNTFGARRALINGSYQPGEFAQVAIVIYLAAWMGSKKAKIRSVAFGLLPFIVLVGIIAGLIMLQPDLSTAVIVLAVATMMYFLAGANILHLVGVTALGVGAAVAVILAQPFSYAQTRVDTFISSVGDLTQADYQVQQAVNAFRIGGISGVGLGQSEQKFGALPAAHTDFILAIVGEELGIIGVTVIVILYIALVIRGLQIARRAVDPFGALLAAGMTLLVATQALLNIAVMAAVVPSTGVPLPFISFGGSSLVSLLMGVGLILSVSRVTALQGVSERRVTSANYDRGGRHRRSRVSRPRSR
ncbi:MAG: cell division protein FtsW [Chloroflexi bacterium]|nr:MAG: cell division protein FtsW [Chloroflexota bacterium]